MKAFCFMLDNFIFLWSHKISINIILQLDMLKITVTVHEHKTKTWASIIFYYNKRAYKKSCVKAKLLLFMQNIFYILWNVINHLHFVYDKLFLFDI
jgi:hypothetical protein